jgi:uncharacterized protein (UPF0303 family)
MVTRHHDQLKASNSWWIARKQEVIHRFPDGSKLLF